jgi:hypothetical protein
MLRKQWRQIALTLPKIAGTIALKSDIPTAQDLSTYVLLLSSINRNTHSPTATVGTQYDSGRYNSFCISKMLELV